MKCDGTHAYKPIHSMNMSLCTESSASKHSVHSPYTSHACSEKCDMHESCVFSPPAQNYRVAIVPSSPKPTTHPLEQAQQALENVDDISTPSHRPQLAVGKHSRNPHRKARQWTPTAAGNCAQILSISVTHPLVHVHAGCHVLTTGPCSLFPALMHPLLRTSRRKQPLCSLRPSN